MIKITDLLNLEHTIAKSYLEKYTYPWEALDGIGAYIKELGKELSEDDYKQVKEDVWIHHLAEVADTASITGPCIIGAKTQVRHCAYIRGNALVGDECVVGNSVELKNVIMFNNVQVPHFNYAGDSILGYKSHMGAGSITSNVKSDTSLVEISTVDKTYLTGRKKVGAVLGDYVEVGCNSVLNPGTIIGRNSNIYPLTSVRGVVPESCIAKSTTIIVEKK